MRELSGAAIVSGGASGLGAAAAAALHAHGLAVLVADVDEEHGAEVAARLGDRAAFARTDVTDPEAVEVAVARAAALDPAGLRLSVACAGIGTPERLLGRDGPHGVDGFRQVLDVDLFGTSTAAGRGRGHRGQPARRRRARRARADRFRRRLRRSDRPARNAASKAGSPG